MLTSTPHMYQYSMTSRNKPLKKIAIIELPSNYVLSVVCSRDPDPVRSQFFQVQNFYHSAMVVDCHHYCVYFSQPLSTICSLNLEDLKPQVVESTNPFYQFNLFIYPQMFQLLIVYFCFHKHRKKTHTY